MHRIIRLGNESEITHLIIVGPHHGEDGGNAEVREEDDGERHDDGEGYVALGILRLLARSGDGVEADETVEADSCALHYTFDAEGHEATHARVRHVRWYVRHVDVPVARVRCNRALILKYIFFSVKLI